MSFTKSVEKITLERTYLTDDEGNRFSYEAMIETIECLCEDDYAVFFIDEEEEYASYLADKGYVKKNFEKCNRGTYYTNPNIKALSTLHKEIVSTAESAI